MLAAYNMELIAHYLLKLIYCLRIDGCSQVVEESVRKPTPCTEKAGCKQSILIRNELVYEPRLNQLQLNWDFGAVRSDPKWLTVKISDSILESLKVKSEWRRCRLHESGIERGQPTKPCQVRLVGGIIPIKLV